MVIDPYKTAVDIVRIWVPFVTAIGAAWRVYASGKALVTRWANTLLDNHLHHIQVALDKQTELLQKLLEK